MCADARVGVDRDAILAESIKKRQRPKDETTRARPRPRRAQSLATIGRARALPVCGRVRKKTRTICISDRGFFKATRAKAPRDKKTRLFFFLSAPMGIHPGARAFLSFFRLKTTTPHFLGRARRFRLGFFGRLRQSPARNIWKKLVEKDTFRKGTSERKPRHELFSFRDRRIFLSRRRTQSSIKRTAKKRFLHKRDSEKWGCGSVWKAVSHACHAGNDFPAPPRSRFPNLRLLEKREPLLRRGTCDNILNPRRVRGRTSTNTGVSLRAYLGRPLRAS